MDKEFLNDLTRRFDLDKCTPSELAIYNAVIEVEKIGADVRLTNAVILLLQARNLVADYVDENIENVKRKIL